MIVAHYEVVGKGVKDSSVLKGRSNPQSLARIRPRQCKQPIDRPLRDWSLLKNPTHHFVVSKRNKMVARSRKSSYSTATKRLRMNNSIEKRIEIKAPVSRVWRALTDYREFGEWFRVKLDGPFAPGQVSRGHVTYPGYEHLKWEATVQKMEPERLFSFTWHPYAIDPAVDYSKEPTTLVEFKLEPKEGGTVLSLTESGFDKIPKDRRFEAFRMNEGGWTEQMTNIKRHVEHAG